MSGAPNSPRDRDRRVLSRLIRLSLLGAFALQIVSSLLAAKPSQADEAQLVRGKDLFAINCTSCHGIAGGGTAQGPSLRGVGAASIDFMLSTGRMPLGDPAQQPQRQLPKFDQTDIDALVAYVTSMEPGGPEIPLVDPSSGNLSEGMQAFVNTCASCHGSGATGDSVGGGQIAPPLYDATPVQTAEAIRTGPGVMPRFSERTITPEQVSSIVLYIDSLRTNDERANIGGAQLGRVGAVAEGFVALVIGLGLLTLVVYLTGSKT